MAELFFLGAEVLFGVRTGSDFAGNALEDLDPGALKRLNLVRIVREQPHARHA